MYDISMTCKSLILIIIIMVLNGSRKKVKGPKGYSNLNVSRPPMHFAWGAVLKEIMYYVRVNTVIARHTVHFSANVSHRG